MRWLVGLVVLGVVLVALVHSPSLAGVPGILGGVYLLWRAGGGIRRDVRRIFRLAGRRGSTKYGRGSAL